MQYLLPITATDRYSVIIGISPKFNIFNIPAVRARVAVVYFMAQSCIHIEINYYYSCLNLTKICRIYPLITGVRDLYRLELCLFLDFTTGQYQFHKILRKRRNSAEVGKFRRLAQHSAFHGEL